MSDESLYPKDPTKDWALETANRQLRARVKELENAYKELTQQIERLDEAMATPERIAKDIKSVGGFVSGLDLTETAEQIVNRAIERINTLSVIEDRLKAL